MYKVQMERRAVHSWRALLVSTDGSSTYEHVLQGATWKVMVIMTWRILRDDNNCVDMEKRGTWHLGPHCILVVVVALITGTKSQHSGPFSSILI